MSEVLVFKSDTDGKLFEDKNDYLKHLRKLAAVRCRQKKIDQAQKDREGFLLRMGQVPCPAALEQFIRDNWDWFFHNGHVYNNWRNIPSKKHTLVGISITVEWSDRVSNSHECPRSGVTNWGMRDATKPASYPGLQGRINFYVQGSAYTKNKIQKFYDGFGSDYFKYTPIHCGTGGGGYQNKAGVCQYTYDLKLFAEDFPGITESNRRAKVWNALSGDNEGFIC